MSGPCPCGDPFCPRCFSTEDRAYAAAMERLNLPDDADDPAPSRPSHGGWPLDEDGWER